MAAVHTATHLLQGEVRNSGGGVAESECGTGRVLQDRLNQLHEGLASKEKHRKVCSRCAAQHVMQRKEKKEHTFYTCNSTRSLVLYRADRRIMQTHTRKG